MEANMEQRELINKCARLETQVDMLQTELTDLQYILIQVGFPEGITTLKETAKELLEESTHQSSLQDS